MLLPLGLRAQDTAEAIVQQYLRMLNYEALPNDSLLILETTITFHGSNDTFSMRRWYASPNMMRLEVWHGDTLTTGLCTNGSSRFREYSQRQGWWNDVEQDRFRQKINAYDFRGSLYNWQQNGIKLRYMGTTTLKGEKLQVVQAKQKDNYVRYYMFEDQRGLMVLMQEKDEDSLNVGILARMYAIKPIDYKVVHEYTPVGESLIMSQESFMREGLLTIMETTARFEPRDNRLFNRDR